MATRKTAGATTATKKTNTEVKETETKTIVPKDIDPNTIVVVKNGYQGKLIYKSPRTGEKFVWDEFGDSQDIELRELRNAKSSAKKFFEKNWFMFDEENEWVIGYLGLNRFYENAIPLDEFDDIFDLPVDKMVDKIKKLSDGQKRSVSYRARELVLSREIDSMKVIEALEDVFGIELIEK